MLRTIMPLRAKKCSVNTLSNEKVLLQRNGACSPSKTGPWKPGRLRLTNRRLLFFQPYPDVTFQAALGDVLDVGVGMGRYVLGIRKKMLYLLKQSEGRTTSAWFAVDNPAQWEDEVRKAVVLGRLV